ncbi:glycosyltransferase family 4 protein [Candidatus Actinomarina]|nr:glycosyltransferase family 4 protein [Candidatus Actinomarina sp.]|tara:strand:- start:136 stop:1284 length:1149 start_codon:yes stop_codon:yes gene_type:complete
MKKLLIVHNFYKEFGGEDANIHEEIKFFKKEYEVSFFFEKNKYSLSIFNVLSFIFFSNPTTNNKFIDFLDDFEPDVVYIHNTWFKINLGIFTILKKRKIKVLLKIHNFRYDCGRHFFAKKHLKNNVRCHACGFNKPYLFILNRYYQESYIKSFILYLYSLKYFSILLKHEVTLLAISQFHKQKLIEFGINEERIQVFNNPVVFRDYPTVKKNNSVIYAGRISKEKGVEELITSWLKSNLSDHTLYIIGEGELKNFLEKKYQKNIGINFLGYLPNNQVLELISKAKAVVTATKLYEGQPRLLCEASSLGTLSIYPSFGGMDEFFPEGYKYSFEQFNYDELSRVLNLLQDDKLQQEAVKKSQDHIYSKLNEEKIYNDFSELIGK